MSSVFSKRPVVHTSVRGSQASLWGNRDLIWSLGKRDLQARYKNTFLGWLWSILIPLGMLGIYWLVFSVIFRAVPPPMGDGKEGNYAIWVLVGIVAWGIFSNSLTMGLDSVLAARPLLQKVYFPSYVATFGLTLGIGIQSAIEFGLIFILLGLVGNIGWTWLLVPVAFVVFAVFTACLAYCLAVANIYFRDVGQGVPILLQMLFFMSAIIFPLSMVPEEIGGFPLSTFMMLNPLAQFIEVFRDLMYGLAMPSAGVGLYLVAWTLAAVAACAFVYRRWGQDVGEMT